MFQILIKRVDVGLVFVGLVLWVAAVQKWIDPVPSVLALKKSLGITKDLATWTIGAVVAIETTFAGLLIFGNPSNLVLKMTTSFLAVLSLYIIFLYQNPTTGCGCGDIITFGKTVKRQLEFSMLRNAVLIGICLNAIQQNRNKNKGVENVLIPGH
jgi:hypothetical protein